MARNIYFYVFIFLQSKEALYTVKKKKQQYSFSQKKVAVNSHDSCSGKIRIAPTSAAGSHWNPAAPFLLRRLRPSSPRAMLRLPVLLPLKPSTPTTGLNPTRRSHGHRGPKRLLASSTTPPPPPRRTPNPATAPKPPKPEPRAGPQNPEGATAEFPTTKPRKPRRGRRSEAAAVEDFVRDRLEQVFASIQERDPEVLQGKGDILKPKEEELASDAEPGEEDGEQKTVVEEEDPSWPLDADVGWGVRASEYFDKHSIKNVTVDGVEIDWEGEVGRGWVKEINCLEWESFAFHPSPLIVLVFERYNR